MKKGKFAGTISDIPSEESPDLEGTVSLKEPAIVRMNPSMLCHLNVYPIQWMGERHTSCDVYIDHCCKENEDRCLEIFVQRSDAPSNGRNPKNFKRVLFHEEPVDNCPFCGAPIEFVEEPRDAGHHWY